MIAIYLLLGVAVGVLSGIVGIGGGIVIVSYPFVLTPAGGGE